MFLELEKEFNTIYREHICEGIRKRYIHSIIIEIIKSMYKSNKKREGQTIANQTNSKES